MTRYFADTALPDFQHHQTRAAPILEIAEPDILFFAQSGRSFLNGHSQSHALRSGKDPLSARDGYRENPERPLSVLGENDLNFRFVLIVRNVIYPNVLARIPADIVGFPNFLRHGVHSHIDVNRTYAFAGEDIGLLLRSGGTDQAAEQNCRKQNNNKTPASQHAAVTCPFFLKPDYLGNTRRPITFPSLA